MERIVRTLRNHADLLVVLVLAAVVYGLTLARDYTWMHWGSDAGDLIGAVYTLGVPHPPGTPIYILLTQLFRFLPVGAPAFRTNLASAVYALAALALLVETGRRIGHGRAWAALAGGLYLAFSPVFWSQAIITEVLSLHVLLSGALIYSLVRLEESNEEKWLFAAFFFEGLALSNHTTAAMLLPPVAYLLISRYGLGLLRPRRLAASLAALGIGLLPYLYIPIRAAAEPAINWGRPASWRLFAAHVAAVQYRPMLFYHSLPLMVDGGVRFLSSFADNFTVVGLALAALGLVMGAYSNRLKVFTGFVFLFQVLFLAEYKIANIETFNLLAFWVAALWLVMGVEVAAGLLDSFRGFLRRKIPVLLLSIERPVLFGGGQITYPLADFLLAVPVLCLVFLPVWRLPRLWSRIDASKDKEAVAYGEGVFDVLQPGAVVFTEGDRFSLVLEYERWVVHPERDDVAVMVNGLYLKDWRLEHYRRLYPWLKFPERPVADSEKQAFDDLLEMIALNIDEHPIYITLDYPPPNPRLSHRIEMNDWVLQSEGPIYRVVGRRGEA